MNFHLFQVKNCDRLSKPRLVKPNFNTEEPVCPDGELQCGNGECVDQSLFCDKKPDCADGRLVLIEKQMQARILISDCSDENACSVTEDPNRADVSFFPNMFFLNGCYHRNVFFLPKIGLFKWLPP